MPTELVEEVWQEMCHTYQSKALHQNNIEKSSQQSIKKQKIEENEEEKEEEEEKKEISNELTYRIYQTKELEDILLNWGMQAEDHLISLISYGKWLITKNQLDKVSFFLVFVVNFFSIVFLFFCKGLFFKKNNSSNYKIFPKSIKTMGKY